MAEAKTVFTRLRRSISHPPVRPGTEKKRAWAAYENLILHIHPRKVPLASLTFTLTWGLGGMCAVLFFLLAASGMLLLFVYEPFPEKAYQSVLTLQNEVLFGQLVRNIHYWSANFLILAAFLHLLRVFYTGAFHSVRQFNWVIGVFLFTGIILSNFTGYLLPWDQLSYWAVTISTGMTEYIPLVGGWFQTTLQGSDDTGSHTLMIFFTLHTTVLPGAMVTLMAYHFWRIRKAGGVVLPPSHGQTGQPPMVDTLPNLAVREAVTALILLAVLLIVSVAFNAPLGEMANPGLSPNPAKAPWYFMGFQELLLHVHPSFAVCFIPAALFLLCLILPYFRYDHPSGDHEPPSGIWFVSTRGKRAGIIAAITAGLFVPAAIVINEYAPGFSGWFPGLPPIVTDGIVPTGMACAAIAVFYRLIKTRVASVNTETTLALFTLAVVSFALLTLTGVWFRGEGMGLVQPFWPLISGD
ncbi:cytochrome b N-terminal domain-containing protein [Desulfoluna spongiiphila]|uniref:cytochrome b N-terminal domain-containing protein n=1 Tax=Desulfoluna spongiiphila TaxID=419481 RepID=UPI0012561603|nr:cytochrome b N-terminal domain-containing protein [Desulfoluna spongiiphila]VVS91408.1 di-haem cytochrome transmembrane [Desulfoluna spongiiphila]